MVEAHVSTMLKSFTLLNSSGPGPLDLYPNVAAEPGRLAHWWLHLFRFDFNVVHGTGVKPHVTNTLFCLTTTVKNQVPIEDEVQVTAPKSQYQAVQIYALQ